MISIYNPDISKYSSSAIDAINSGWISNHGIYIEKAKTVFKEIIKCKYAILMSNGTCATHCLFLSIQYKFPDINKIYVPNNAYVAAWNSALMVYNISQLELMKMDLNNWNIDTTEEYIKSLDQNSAVLIVHNLGNIVNVSRLKRIRPDLIFVEDNCEGLFGKYEGIYSGTSSGTLCASASFYGNKIITTGEGGVFYTNDEELYNHISKVFSQGMSNIRYLHDVHAYNYRMTNIQSAFLYDQLTDITTILNKKQQLFEKYEMLLEKLIKSNNIKLFVLEADTEKANWIFAVRIVNNNCSVEKTVSFFHDAGVDIRPFFYPINKHSHLVSIKNDDITSDILNREIIMIPSSPTITIEEQYKVVQTISEFVLSLKNIKIVKIDNINKGILTEFIKTIDSDKFRYFLKRDIKCIVNHKATFLFYDTIKNDYFGYSHIDYETDKNWFGIYLHKSYRGLKLGGLILNHTILHLTPCSEINLSVDSDNINAIKLYQKNGFEKINDNELTTYMKLKLTI